MNIESLKNDLGSASSARIRGQSSRTTILLAATKLATLKGLSGLSLSDVAAEVGMSKSGLYAHFKDKEDLELAMIDTAATIFDTEVMQPALQVPAGTERIKALADSFLSHVERLVFPGGCFFAAAVAELDTRPGLAKDRVVGVLANWFSLLRQCLIDGQELGQVDPKADVAQAVFEIEGMLLAANFLFIMMNDVTHLQQGRVGVENVLNRIAV